MKCLQKKGNDSIFFYDYKIQGVSYEYVEKTIFKEFSKAPKKKFTIPGVFQEFQVQRELCY